jgi:hypothetical protein
MADMTPDEQKHLFKQAVKEAACEWLDEIYRKFGKWALRSFGAALAVGLLYLVLMLNGWSHVPDPPAQHTSQHQK